MPYVKTNWVDNVTQMNAINLNKIEQGIADHDAQLAENVQQLSEIPNKSYNSSLVKQHISKPLQGQGNGLCISIMGDSKVQGMGASDISKSYPSIIFDAIKKITNNGNGAGYELNGNFSVPPSGFVYGGSTSYGTLGPCKKSLIMQVGSTITFTRKCTLVELFFHKTPTSGKIEFRADGALYRTFDCSGVDTLDASTLGSPVILDGASHVFTLTCITASVELTGVECWGNTVTANSIYYNRFGVAGTVSGYWADSAILQSIKTVGTIDGRKSVFIIDLGTNDCYQVGGAVSSATYKANMTTIINSLMSAGHYVVLTIPPKANEVTFPPILEPYVNYRQVIVDLAKQFNLPCTDLSTIDFTSNSWYFDGVHYNDNGHYPVGKYTIDTLGIPLNTLPTIVQNYSYTFNVSAMGAGYQNMNYNLQNKIPLSAHITGVYIKNTVNGLIVAYQDYTDYANNIGLFVQKDFPTAGTVIYYMTVGGFCKTGRGPLGSLTTNTPANAQIIVEYTM